MKHTKIFLIAILLASQAICSSKEVSQGCNNFAFNLYSQLSKESGNIFFSPFSIHNALSVCYAGATGKTEAEMTDVLGNRLSQEAFHSTYSELLNNLNREDKPYDLAVANKLFIQSGRKFLPSFASLITKNYGAVLGTVDFMGNPQEASDIINAWVEENTYGKIKDIVNPGVCTSDTALAIANAIYFKGKWLKQFEKSKTKKQSFYLDGSSNDIRIDMMQQEDDFRYMENENLQMLELPYKGQELSMFVVLPKKLDGLQEVELTLSEENVTKWISKLATEKVDVKLPKFKLETTHENLVDILSKMGMPSACNDFCQDFVGIIENPVYFYIDMVIHKAFIETDEEGSEAAAATVILMKSWDCCTFELPPKLFVADHPFIFFIRNNQNGLILFMGRIDNPKI